MSQNIVIFEYFPKKNLEMNSAYPFYPILIPNTSDVIFFVLIKKIFLQTLVEIFFK